MTEYELVKRELRERSASWLVTGVAGFVGSNLLEVLLDLDQTVLGLDNARGENEQLGHGDKDSPLAGDIDSLDESR